MDYKHNYSEMFFQERRARQLLEAEVKTLRHALRRQKEALQHLDLGIVMYEAALAASNETPKLQKVA
jgi:hypothetical protein